MLNSAEHEFCPANKSQITYNCKFFLAQLSWAWIFVLLINLKLLTIANSFLLNIAEHDIFSANKYENANFSWHFHIY